MFNRKFTPGTKTKTKTKVSFSSPHTCGWLHVCVYAHLCPTSLLASCSPTHQPAYWGPLYVYMSPMTLNLFTVPAQTHRLMECPSQSPQRMPAEGRTGLRRHTFKCCGGERVTHF